MKICLFLLVSILPFQVSAENTTQVPEKELVITSDYLVNDGENIMIFQNQEGVDLYFESLLIEDTTWQDEISHLACFPGDLYYPTCKPPTAGGSTRDILVKAGIKIPKKFIGYSVHTKSGTKASNYTVSQSKGFSAAYSINIENKYNFNVTVQISSGVSRDIPADSEKYSKLGGYASFKYDSRVLIVTDNNGKEKRAPYVTKPVVDQTYLEVVYQ